MLTLAVVGIGSYLLGSIPFGYLAGKIAGIDIRKVGSGNIGATNVVRALGKRYGYTVFALDFLKGFGAVTISMSLVTDTRPEWVSAEIIGIFAAVASVIGHSFPLWLKFRGGKGVATSVGALFGLVPLAAVIAVIIWISIFWFTRYVSVASVVTAIALPFVILLMTRVNEIRGNALFYFSLGMAAVVIWRHHSNISRLMHGSEPRFTRK
ncbi:MAG: acyl-phosphate glycerol 3-phosphate acyltransferase [Verrucomicrobia bacterium]|nr:MAG: acyl-phosphate glycerol 3-phosphate acyltransferase [Verrucomicrobiota bacterium]PYL62602.1 MAG: acyl-phosphate glycerol 3-phosphate acyltransferase [Verrucomicrobiota bacterium]